MPLGEEQTKLGPAAVSAVFCAGKRPLNSALEIDADFERAIRLPPQPTQEALEALEDVIKRRIADHDFDDPPLVVAPASVQPRPQLELSDQRSAQASRATCTLAYELGAMGQLVCSLCRELDEAWACLGRAREHEMLGACKVSTRYRRLGGSCK